MLSRLLSIALSAANWIIGLLSSAAAAAPAASAALRSIARQTRQTWPTIIAQMIDGVAEILRRIDDAGFGGGNPSNARP